MYIIFNAKVYKSIIYKYPYILDNRFSSNKIYKVDKVKERKICTKIEHIDGIGKAMGTILRSPGIDISLFGDSILEESQAPDIDLIEDDNQIAKLLGDKRRYIEASIIEDNKKPENFSDVTCKQNYDDNFRIEYAIDGSIRTKYMGEISYGSKGGPIVAGNIGAVATRINYEKRRVEPGNNLTKIIFYFPDILPDSIKEKLKNVETQFNQIQIDYISEIETPTSLRSAAGGKIRNIMHENEIDLAQNHVSKDRNWLLMDGALRKSTFYSLPKTIGVAKSFGQKIIFLGNDGKPPRNISHLSKLGQGKRSPVYKYQLLNSQQKDYEGDIDTEKLVFWYLKLRESPPEMAPLGGIVKIDLVINSDMEKATITEYADKLSHSVLRIMDPSIFPRPRWPSFVYPVRVCEEYLDSLLLNALEFNRIGVMLRSVIS